MTLSLMEAWRESGRLAQQRVSPSSLRRVSVSSNSTMSNPHDPVDEEEEEEEEPKLKYERVGRGVEELMQKDTVSCLVAHEKFIVRWDNLCIFDQ